MPRMSKADIIREYESTMADVTFSIMMAIKHGRLSDHLRDDLLRAHFELAIRGGAHENRIEDICRRHRQHLIAQQPGPWPEGHFDRPAAS
jgi:hypothetical protein